MVATAAFKAFYDGTGRTCVHLVASIAMNIGNFALCGALVLYAAISTALPSLVLKQPFDPSPLEPRVPGEPA